jgi:hypothetical protein
MEFIYANKLKKQFSVFGYFYNLELKNTVFNCRSVLEIVSQSVNNLETSKPCAVVVMMNPGSSRPLDSDYKIPTFNLENFCAKLSKKILVPTRPDNAQYQIMRLMLLNNWKHVRVLNLSDLRNGNSGEFSKEYKKAAVISKTPVHSLLAPQRKNELLNYCADSKLIIAAWGSNSVLKDIAQTFLKEIPTVVGLQLEVPWFRYPSPYKKDQKIDWLICMNKK